MKYLPIAFSFFLFFSCKQRDDKAIETVVTPVWQPLPAPETYLSNWRTDSNVIIHTLSDPDNLHPVNGNSLSRLELNLYLHCSLLQTDLRTSEMRPGLCTSLPKVSDDQLELTFELRPGPHWDNGTPVTAADVIFTAKASKCPLVNNPASKPYFENVKNIIPDAVNSRKFTVVMKKPYFQNIGIWCDYPIIQRAFYDSSNVLSRYTFAQFDDPVFNLSQNKDIMQWAEWFNSRPSGTDPSMLSGAGPYTVEKWEPGQYITLRLKPQHWTHRSENYWEKSYPPKLIFRLNRDAAAQQLAFLGQEFDGGSSLSARTLFELRKDSAFNANYHSAFINTYCYTYIALNTKPSANHHIALSDKAVRKALAYAVPVERVIQMVNKGVNKRIAGPVSFLKKSCDTTLILLPYDPAKAGDLLQLAGWKDSDKDGIRDKVIDGKKLQLTLELAYLSVQPEWKEMAIIISEGLAQAGVKVIANGFDFPVWLDKLATHDFDMAMGAWNSTAMPDDFSQLWSLTSYKDNGPNYTGFGNAESEALIDSMNVIMDDAQRIPLERKLQRIIYDEQPYIFLYGLVRRSVIHKRYSGAGFFAERPGILYNTLRVDLSGVKNTADVKP